jgi:hypothetical protein
VPSGGKAKFIQGKEQKPLLRNLTPQEAILSPGRILFEAALGKKHFWNYHFRYTSTNSN